MIDLYAEALSVLNEFADTLLFPIYRYRFHGIRALIADDADDHEFARDEAQLALEAAAAEHSGLRYHPSVGLVRDAPGEAHSRLQAIAGRSSS